MTTAVPTHDRAAPTTGQPPVPAARRRADRRVGAAPRPPRAAARIVFGPQALAAVFARFAFTRPAWVVAGAMLLVCYPETSTDVSASVHVTPIDLGTVLIVGSVLPEWLRALAGRGPAPFPKAVAWILGAVVCSLALSTIGSTDLMSSLSGFVRYVQLFVVVPAATATAITRSKGSAGSWSTAAGPILGSLIGIGLFESAYGTWQALTGNGSSYAGSDIRAVGTFGSLDVMGMATVIGFGMVAALALALVTAGWQRAAALAALGAMCPAMVFSLSRGSWIATFVACAPLAVLIWGRKLVRWTLLGACAALVALGLTGGLAALSASNASGQAAGSTSIVARFTSIFSSTSDPDQSVTDRYSLWTAATGIGEEYPVSGVGLKQFQNYRDSKAPLALSGGGQTDSATNGFQVEPLLSPHNMYFLALSEQGLPGLAVFAFLLIGLPLLALLAAWRRRRAGPAELALALAAAGWGLWGMVDFLYADIGGPTTVLLSVLIGIVLAHAVQARGQQDRAPAAESWPGSGARPGALSAVIPAQAHGPANAFTPFHPTTQTTDPIAGAHAEPMIDIRSFTAGAHQDGVGAVIPAPTAPRPLPRRYGDPEPTPPDEIVPGQTMPDRLPPAPRDPDAPGGLAGRLRSISVSRLVRGSLVTTALNLGGSVLGLGRDLLLAKFFGASGGTDAFLVAWTIPETAAPLLIEDGMSYLMVPVFSKAARTRRGTRFAVDSTWLPLTAALSAVSLVLLAIAPLLVKVLAPGLADPSLAITCTRLACLTVLFFGLTGYCAAGLRSHHVFGSPAAIYVAYNVGILLLMIDGHARFGVAAAAAGLSVGAGLMVAVQAPSFVRVLGRPGRPVPAAGMITMGAVGPIVAFALLRQAQVFVERYFGSQLDPGTISLLNYSQKVSQVPMSLAVMITAVSFPTLSRAVQAGQLDVARKRIRKDLSVAASMVGASTLVMIVASPLIIKILFQHGEFTAADTSATAGIMRVYVLGLVGQTVVGVIGRLYFSRRPSWFPAIAMAFGLVATAVISKLFLTHLGASAIALGNAAGITLTALIMLGGATHMLHKPSAAGPAPDAEAEQELLEAPAPRRYDEL